MYKSIKRFCIAFLNISYWYYCEADIHINSCLTFAVLKILIKTWLKYLDLKSKKKVGRNFDPLNFGEMLRSIRGCCTRAKYISSLLCRPPCCNCLLSGYLSAGEEYQYGGLACRIPSLGSCGGVLCVCPLTPNWFL